MLEEPVNDGDPRPYNMAKWAYMACMDEEQLEVWEKNQLNIPLKAEGLFQKMELRPISEFTKNYLKELGGWPLIAGDSWEEEKFTWYDTHFSFLRTDDELLPGQNWSNGVWSLALTGNIYSILMLG